MEEGLQLFKALSDKSRLRIIAALKEGPMYVELLAVRLELSQSKVSFHLKKLEEAELVTSFKDQYYVQFSLNKGLLMNRMLDLIEYDEVELERQRKIEKEYKRKILNTYFVEGKVETIPVQKEKRKIIFEEILKGFNIDKQYSEKEVNLIIADFTDDFSNVRNDMVREKLLYKYNGVYFLSEESIRKLKAKNSPELINKFIWNDEEIVLSTDDIQKIEIKALRDKKILDKYLVITNKGRILVQVSNNVKPLGNLNYVYTYNFQDANYKLGSGLFDKILKYDVYDDKKLSCKADGDKIICEGKNFKIRGENGIGGIGTVMNIEFTITEANYNKARENVIQNLFEWKDD